MPLSDLSFPHCSAWWVETAPPRKIIHIRATIPQFPASCFASERDALIKRAAEAVGTRRDYDGARIHWSDNTEFEL